MEYLEKLMAEIAELKNGCELLHDVHLEVGCDGKISDKLRYKIQDFFHYDDSE